MTRALGAGALPIQAGPSAPKLDFGDGGQVWLDGLGLTVVGLDRIELSTSPLSGVRSSQLSYRPNLWGAGLS